MIACPTYAEVSSSILAVIPCLAQKAGTSGPIVTVVAAHRRHADKIMSNWYANHAERPSIHEKARPNRRYECPVTQSEVRGRLISLMGRWASCAVAGPVVSPA